MKYDQLRSECTSCMICQPGMWSQTSFLLDLLGELYFYDFRLLNNSNYPCKHITGR